jgi:hypothetical protein
MTGALRMSLVSGVLAALLASCDGRAADGGVDEARLTLDRTVISASQELPKVLYIVPWQTPTGRPDLPATAGLADDGFWQRVRPAEHRREVLYQERSGGGSPKE